ncbi:hypothetical protein UFOVP27_76 [uncultured Caudovirales phage]|uniref:SWIM-type domain-containing protein n=1 Tax=uncultured Caudovirales phage TaxID=2100421 RepID=A0A6J5KLY7_9CAUD|nr:hypothetical protein UFOVP27_76 [uncultured Caudovirales phage]
MKESNVYWMVTQIFLSETGVHEVDVHHSSHKLRCNCIGYSTRGSCKHTRFVKEKMNKNGGVYPVEISNKIDRETSIAASQDPDVFRELLVKYGKIVTI